MTRKKILILAGAQLCDNPRVPKEAQALSDAGYDVEVTGALFRPESREVEEGWRNRSWRYTRIFDATDPANQSHWKKLRIRRKLGLLMHRWLGIQCGWQLGYLGPELVSHAKRRQADLTIAHHHETPWVGWKLLQSGMRVGFDVEDWYSEDYLPENKSSTPIRLLKKCEGELLRRGASTTTTSIALSEGLAKHYGARKPKVVFNTFPLAERDGIDGKTKDRKAPDKFSLFWFSQTIGPGRGLELFAEAAGQLPDANVEFHFRGRIFGNYGEELRALFPERHRASVYFHDLVPHSELLSRIAEHDIGLALEQTHCASRDLTITNKIIQYLHGGIPVLASDTGGQREVAKMAPEAVRTFRHDSAGDLAEVLRGMMNRGWIDSGRSAARKITEEVFCWEKSAPVLVDSVNTALEAA